MKKRSILLCLLLAPALLAAAAAREETCILNDILYGENAGWSETTLGSAAADALVWETGAQAAILPGGMVLGNLRGGAVTRAEVGLAVDSETPLAVAQVEPARLFGLLEDGYSHLTLNERERLDAARSDSDAFPQVSGLSVRVDASRPAGSRVAALTLNGSELSPEDTQPITLCGPAALLAQWGTDCRPLPDGRTAGVILYDYIAAGALSQAPGSRLEIIGTLDDSVMDRFPPAALGVALAIFILFGILSVRQNGRPASRRYGTR